MLEQEQDQVEPVDPDETQPVHEDHPDDGSEAQNFVAVVADTDGDGIPDDLDLVDDSVVAGIDTRIAGDD